MEGCCNVELLVSDLLPDARIAQDFDGLISAFGRLPETTKGCFVEAKSEKQCLGIRPVWRISVGWFGSLMPIHETKKQSFTLKGHRQK
jgi:hypothetical protein